MRHSKHSALAIAAIFLAVGFTHAQACGCGPNFAETSDIFAIEALAIELHPTGGSPAMPVPSVVSYRVAATLRGTPRSGGKLIHAGHFMGCGPPMQVGASYIVALSNSDQREVPACNFQRVLRDDQIDMTRRFLETLSK